MIGELLERTFWKNFRGYTEALDYPTHSAAIQAAKTFKIGAHSNDGMATVSSVDTGNTAIFVHYEWDYNYLRRR